ncbi:minor tail protein [Gordonia phage OhMyWard]|uniref:Minor tail protein n=1 Tax=Gordonia phage OhMyWard TaxID=2652414 RepID=A0A5P8D7B1_9CAUD|nr:minor tail protein [Gordonia phage OhMyWard]QFP94915.1 minor tail protein [Gordonia phage OhMyWard]
MKFDQVILTGTKSITLFDLNSPRSTPYTARTIEGLDPTDVDVTLAQTSGGTGVYIGRREQLREIVANIYMNPNYFVGQSVEALREELYLMNPINEDNSLDFRLMFEGEEVAITPVYIKRVETAVFSKDTILQLVLASTSGVFRRRNPISDPDPPLDKVNPVLHNAGTAMSGFRVEVDILAPTNKFGLRQAIPTDEITIEKVPEEPDLLLAGDRLIIDTNIGHRGVWRKRAGVTTSLMGSLTFPSTWLSLYPGNNTLEVLLSSAAHATTVDWALYEHTPKYRGV